MLTRDPDGEERRVACNLRAVARPVQAVSLQKAETKDGRWYPEFSAYVLSSMLHLLRPVREEACPTTAIQLTLTSNPSEYNVRICAMKRGSVDFGPAMPGI